MISQRERGELARFYTVTDPKKHKKGYTVYKVTARIISRKNPEDVQEITVWKRYSDFRKLHRDLWQIHKNLYRESELFPPFAKAKVFGRFDDSVIEERRQCSEDLLQFSANIPALYGSQYIQDFFKGGEVQDGSDLIGPAEPFSDFLADSLSDCSSEVQKDSSGLDDLTANSQSEYGGPSSDSDLTSFAVADEDSLAELDDGMASGALLSSHSQRAVLFPSSLKNRPGKKDYLERASEQIRLAVQKEAEQDYQAALTYYRSGVDLLLQGVQGEVSPSRREAVKRKTAEYLMRAEQISVLHLTDDMGQNSTQNRALGPQCCGVAWGHASQADELRNYRVLGVIDKVLLVMDKRTQETFILKGLRKSSECGRVKKTIIPRSVPNMVQLRKYIISENSIFLLLEYAEGGKLWSHISKYLRSSSDSPDESFDIPFIQKSHTTAVRSAQALLPELGSSSSADSGPTQDLQIQGASLLSVLLPESGATSEEECTNSYLTLCTEYEQEKVEPEVLGEGEEDGVEVEEDTDVGAVTSKSSRTRSLLSNDSLCSPSAAQELRFFTEDDADRERERDGNDVFSPLADRPVTPDSLSLDQSKRSPMEFFRIDSKDSATEVVCPDSTSDLRPKHDPCPKPFFLSTSDLGSEVTEDLVDLAEVVEVRGHSWGYLDSDRGSNESVPVISFKDAVVEEEARPPDLLVNLPEVGGVGVEALEEELVVGGVPLAVEATPSPKFGKPDVLQLHHDLGEEAGLDLSVKDNPSSPCNQAQPTEESLAFGTPENMFQGENDPPTDLLPQTPPPLDTLSNSQSHILPSELNSQSECVMRAGSDTGAGLEAGPSPVPVDPEKGEGVEREGKSVSELFRQLDELALVASQMRIPEALVRCWATQLVLALDALHQEGIICRDLNPKNVLLNHRGHVELTFFCSWSEVEESCDREAVSEMYCAPEVGGINEETTACDWWSLGALLFELLTGKSLHQCHPAGISRHTSLHIPDFVSGEARSLLEQLLQYNPVERLGAGVAGVEDIKSHPFFATVDWPH
ncbi:ribosomal protein S6 kinase delta-1 [Chanos chanos]|uniref:Ribosomal protein S6 kinase delta-1 n=1 Tax=Chanos chanos TaxID=29144 RepID=A0A6J2VZD3_CHACN|nr:ribosomal protein S6 kinase delta-1 [Chanos chanos]